MSKPSVLPIYRTQHAQWNPTTSLWELNVKFLGNAFRVDGVDPRAMCDLINKSIAMHVQLHNYRHAVAEHTHPFLTN